MEPGRLRFGLRRRLEIVRAARPQDSILACVSMIAALHGRDLSLPTLREKHRLTKVDLKTAGSIIQQSGFNFRKVGNPAGRFEGIKVPAIIEREDGQFAILSRVRRTGAVLLDPLAGRIQIGLQELAGKALFEITPDVYVRDNVSERAVGLLALWTKSYGLVPAFLQVAGLTALLQALAFVAPLQMQLVIDRAMKEADADILKVICLAFGFVAVMQAVIEALRSWVLQVITQSMTFQAARNLVLHTIRLPVSFFSQRHTGDIMSRLQSSRQMLDIFAQGFVVAIFDGAMAIFLIVILLVYSVKLTFIAIGLLALALIINILIFPAIRSNMNTELSERALEQTLQIEMIRGVTTIKLLGREIDRVAVWSNRCASAINYSIKVQQLIILQSLIRSAIIGIQVVLVTYFGGKMVIAGEGLTVGMLVAFLSYQTLFTVRAQSVAFQLRQFQFLGLHLERVSDLVKQMPDQLEATAVPVVGKIALENVSFAYGGAGNPALSNVDLVISPGEFLAITGPSGGGKTTLVKLILGLYEPSQGRVLLDDRALSGGEWRSWRERVGVVTQDDQLFSGSIAENICFFDPQADFSRIREAAQAAAIDADIMAMPEQYGMRVGDMGAALSAGQRQRVLLARALYRRPRILILDEGTANLDLANERSIGEVIRNLDITRVIVAHRPALIDIADRTVKISRGTLVTDGDDDDGVGSVGS